MCISGLQLATERSHKPTAAPYNSASPYCCRYYWRNSEVFCSGRRKSQSCLWRDAKREG